MPVEIKKELPMIIAVSHSKGGVGKSTIAFNLAIALQKWFRVELVDLDFQQTTTYANHSREANGLSPLPLLTFSSVEDYKKYVVNDSDDKVSIVDVGGFDSELNRMVILTADMVITPVSASGRELLGLKKFSGILDNMSEKIKENIEVRVLLNNINSQKNTSDLEDYISKNKHFNLLNTILRKRVDFDYSMDEGKSVIEYSKNSKASSELRELAEEIKQIIKGDK